MFASRSAPGRCVGIFRNVYRSHIRSHLITFAEKRFESTLSPAHSAPLRQHNYHYNLHLSRSFSRPAMTSVENIVLQLQKLSITPADTVSHAAASSPATWREALEQSSSAPKPFELIKTIVYKPKTAKTATPVPLVVIAREGTDVISGALGKKLNLKEPRLASEDLLTEFFSLDKNSRTIVIILLDLYR